jgi:hypothetical protein
MPRSMHGSRTSRTQMMTRATEKVATMVMVDSTLGKICCQRMQEFIPLI